MKENHYEAIAHLGVPSYYVKKWGDTSHIPAEEVEVSSIKKWTFPNADFGMWSAE